MKLKIIISITFVVAFFLLNQRLIKNESLTFDEPVHIHAGNFFNIGQYSFDPMETPLIRATVTRLANRYHLDHRLLVLTANTFLFVLFGLIFPPSVQILIYFLVLTDPSLVSYSHLFITDVISSLFAFFYYLSIRQKSTRFIYPLIFFTLASASKVATLAFIIPTTIVYWKNLGWKKFAIMSLATFVFIWSTYGFTSLAIFAHHPFTIPFGGYPRTIKENLLFSLRGQPIYFLNEIYLHSPWYKTLLILIFKIPISVIIASLFLVRQAKNYKKDLVVWLTYFLVQSFKSLNFGSRHLLLFNLVLIIIAAHALTRLKSCILAISLVTLQLILFTSVYPFTLSFANPYLPSPEKYLSDSDFDWGGGLLYLSEFVKEAKISEYQLAYNGNVDPFPILGNYLRIKDNNPVASLPIQKFNPSIPTFISVTCFHTCGYRQYPNFARRNYTLVGGSFMYFHE